MKTYDYKKADELLKEFKSVTGFDVSSESRVEGVVLLRCLFYNILTHKNYMKDIQIAHFIKSKGKNPNRSAVFHCLKKTKDYYRDFQSFKSMYDTCFNDVKQSNEEVKLKIEHITLNKDKKALYTALDTLTDLQLKDVREMVELRIKSYHWKNNV